jgi:hypothetical protein
VGACSASPPPHVRAACQIKRLVYFLSVVSDPIFVLEFKP